jgi:hypothetical protein
MSRDASGQYFLYGPKNPVQPNTIIETEWANPTLDDVAAALTDSLSRSGKGGMAAPLAMGGFRITALAAAIQAADAPRADQVRDSALLLINGAASDATGNFYTGSTALTAPPVYGTFYVFTADKDNTGAMTLAVNGNSPLPILVNGSPAPAGVIRTSAIVEVMFQSGAWRLVNSAGATSTINSVSSDDVDVISVTNNPALALATLNIHKNIPLGLVKLDGSAKVPIAQMPFTALDYIGMWNAGPGTNPAAALDGQFYLIVGAGNLTLFRFNVGTNTYVAQVTACVVGDQIVYNTVNTAAQPIGWYYSPAAIVPVLAANVSVVPTPTIPGATAQSWFNNADPIIAGKVNKAGDTLTGPLLQPAAPATGPALANKQYVDDQIGLLPTSVASVNGRSGAVVLLDTDVTGALGYTPANKAGDAFTGPISAPTVNAGDFVATGFVNAKGYIQDEFIVTLAGTEIDFTNGQSQIITLAAPVTITAINNVPVGSMLRLVLIGTTNTVTWPATVKWPAPGVAPSLAAGSLDKAIVVLEWDGTDFLASSSVY